MLAILGIILAGVLGIILLLGLIPISSSGLESEPNPANSYDDAVARFQDFQQAEQGIINTASGSHLLVHGEKTPRAIVMIHGTTNSPRQWLELGETLHARGNNVLILRMPYHGLLSHQVSELTPLTAQDIREYADQTIDIAAGLGDEVVVVGISGGGAVGSWMAQNRPEVDRSLLLSPFYGIGPVPPFLTPFLKNAFSRLPNFVLTTPDEIVRDWAYRGEATRGVAAFLALGQKVINQAKQSIVPPGPMFVVTSASDHTANNRATADLVDLWRQAGADVVAYEFDESLGIPHNSVGVLEDSTKKQMVYDKILELLGEKP